MPLKSPFANYHLPNSTAGSYFLHHFKENGDRIAIVDSDDNGRYYTYDDLYRGSLAIASYLRKLGVRKGDVVGVCCLNFIEIPALMIATALNGAIYSPFNPSYTESEYVKLFGIANPKVVVTFEQCVPKVNKVLQKVTSIEKIISIDEVRNIIKRSNVLSFKEPDIDPSKDVFLMPFSSGTTGLPKGVMLSHQGIVNTDVVVRGSFGVTRGTISLLNVPNFHIYGLMKYLAGLSAGSKIISCQKFTTLDSMLTTVQNYKITDLSTVPPLALGMANLKDLEKYDLSSVVSITCGAAPLAESVVHTIKKRTGIRIYQGWGLTEFVPITWARDACVPVSSVGNVTPNTLLKVIDPETQKELGPNQKGELCAKGPQIMLGYYNRPKATSECIDSDGWFHTGDIGYYDENECVYIVDRLKELIKYKGFQVAPAELEEVLLEHPQVVDAAVIGVKDKEAGELPKAFVVRKHNEVTAEEIHQFVQARVSKYKYLKGGIQFCDSIPKSPSGKILRRLLRDQTSTKSKL